MRLFLRLVRIGAYAGLIILLIAGSVLAYLALENDRESVCYGTPNNGRLENAKRLSYSGENFHAYWTLGWLLGRTNMHGQVRDVVRATYAQLNSSHPDLTFVYGEPSWPWGRRFWPHRTHRNGLSVDFVVPVVDQNGRSVPFPRSFWSGGFYAEDISTDGTFSDYRIDFGAMAAHLATLFQNAETSGVPIRRVIFDPALQKHLFAHQDGVGLGDKIAFSKRRSWFRHDAHYHVDFDIPCLPH